ncbi:MAG: hypothetical protein IM492_02025 [Microcystis sp. M040S2]|uniref:hypothetical protein n=1 Tax=unclassified Microcystis TaxID=2643300 RepID=UPI002584E4A8|nr:MULTISPECIES: hypothetical protein [unclassified Microcystis]MCA2620786.1 hypothetical protein [Microcystis sp. M099S2]MCA2678961.1 hypothetical protein [Microcystis sp. M043S2]MCA2825865.1 hypothetical protein [Microcystis sp. M088S1]MCA2830710.1 hypothetical protein [Microcystis sp. M086S1]MCA2865870.1 hypothetical protein [Microcystis sp. M049S1]MCA2913150.1 hypothetical protein [Microcystis sp. M022S1]MCA2920485.1 hypothetical protein [Microcystis sp. M038S1]MCA2928492.1 hypothetical
MTKSASRRIWWQLILNPLSIGYISGQAKGKRQKAKGGIDNQFLITGFSIIGYFWI